MEVMVDFSDGEEPDKVKKKPYITNDTGCPKLLILLLLKFLGLCDPFIFQNVVGVEV